MTQSLNGIDIYHCTYFEIDSGGRLKFAVGSFRDRTADSFKTISQVNDAYRYCMWILRNQDTMDITKYAALVYINQLSERFKYIERTFQQTLRKKQIQEEKNLNDSVDKPGRTYL